MYIYIDTSNYIIHRIGSRENFQENPIFGGKKRWVPVDFPLNHSIE